MAIKWRWIFYRHFPERIKKPARGGQVPFECGFNDIKALGRVMGVYSEVN
jgi:hypothetical protein